MKETGKIQDPPPSTQFHGDFQARAVAEDHVLVHDPTTGDHVEALGSGPKPVALFESGSHAAAGAI